MMKQKILWSVFTSIILIMLSACGGGGSSSSGESKPIQPEKPEEPSNPAKPANVHLALLQTGQTIKYLDGDDGDLQKGIQRNFVRDDARDIVVDNVNKLQWQDEQYTKEEVKAYERDKEHGKVKTWSHAVEYCSNKGDGWRLPTIKELATIVNYSVVESKVDLVTDLLNDSKGVIDPAFKYAIDKDVAVAGQSNQKYWSSTKGVSGYSSYVFVLVVANGRIDSNGYEGKDIVNYIRCVRDMK